MKRAKSSGLLPYQIVFGLFTAALGGIVALLGELRDEFGFSSIDVGLIVANGFLATFIAQVALGPMADRGHGRAMAVSGMVMCAVAMFMMVVADHVVVWIVARSALGFAGGLLMPGMRRAATVLDPAKAGENLGRLVVGEVIGFVVGPVVAALLAEVGGVRMPFIVGAIVMAVFVPFAARLPKDQGVHTKRVRGSLELLKYRQLRGALVLIVGYFLLIGAFETVFPQMFQDRGGGAIQTGIGFTAFALPIALVSTHAGRIADRVGPTKVALTGMAVSAAITMSIGFLPGISVVIIVMTVNGVFDGYGFTAGQVAVSRAVPEARQAGALGLMGAAEVLGAGISALPASAIYQAAGERTTWLATGAASLVCLAIGRLYLREQPSPAEKVKRG